MANGSRKDALPFPLLLLARSHPSLAGLFRYIIVFLRLQLQLRLNMNLTCCLNLSFSFSYSYSYSFLCCYLDGKPVARVFKILVWRLSYIFCAFCFHFRHVLCICCAAAICSSTCNSFLCGSHSVSSFKSPVLELCLPVLPFSLSLSLWVMAKQKPKLISSTVYIQRSRLCSVSVVFWCSYYFR